MIGNSQRNKWCVFCSHWFDPAHSALKAKPGKGMYEIDTSVKHKCSKKNLITPAISTCKYFNCKL